jgi:hypothetical protein
VAIALGVLSPIWAATFFLGALLHAGITVNLGFAVLEEAASVPPIIVESLCGIALAIGGWAVLTRRGWAWAAATTGHAVALAGVLLGVVAITFGGGTSSPLNDTYHRVMIVVLVAGLVALATPSVRTAFADRSSGSSGP